MSKVSYASLSHLIALSNVNVKPSIEMKGK